MTPGIQIKASMTLEMLVKADNSLVLNLTVPVENGIKFTFESKATAFASSQYDKPYPIEEMVYFLCESYPGIKEEQ